MSGTRQVGSPELETGTRSSGSTLRTCILQDGYTMVRDVVGSQLLDDLRRETTALVDGFYSGRVSGPDCWFYPIDGQAKPVLYRIHNLEKQTGCPAVARLFEHGPLHSVASECLGQQSFPTVCAAVVKIPRIGAPVPWHRDRDHDELPPGKAVNVSLYLHDSVAQNGCLQVVPGSQGFGGEIDPVECRRSGPVLSVTAQAGDATVHDVRLVHGSGANPEDALCIRIVMEFCAASLPAAMLLRER